MNVNITSISINLCQRNFYLLCYSGQQRNFFDFVIVSTFFVLCFCFVFFVSFVFFLFFFFCLIFICYTWISTTSFCFHTLRKKKKHQNSTLIFIASIKKRILPLRKMSRPWNLIKQNWSIPSTVYHEYIWTSSGDSNLVFCLNDSNLLFIQIIFNWYSIISFKWLSVSFNYLWFHPFLTTIFLCIHTWKKKSNRNKNIVHVWCGFYKYLVNHQQVGNYYTLFEIMTFLFFVVPIFFFYKSLGTRNLEDCVPSICLVVPIGFQEKCLQNVNTWFWHN